MRLALFALVLAACSSSSHGTPDGAAAPAFTCSETIDQLRAMTSSSVSAPDYVADFTTASAACDANLNEDFERCDGQYDTMTWYSFPNCGGKLFYDKSGQLVAVLEMGSGTGDVCRPSDCLAGPPQFFAAGANCTTVVKCGPP